MVDETEKQSIISGGFDNTTVLGIQRVIAELNRKIKFKIQLTADIDFMFILDAIEKLPCDNKDEQRKITGICDYLRLRENLRTFNMIQKTLRGTDLIMLIGESGGEKIDFTKIIKELLGKESK